MSATTSPMFGHYRLGPLLGRGGMATVYVGEDTRHGRRVAIKVLNPELAAAVGADRFLSEIRTTATLQHPHIVGLIDSGESDGALYYVMPLIEGESLRDRLVREGQLPVDEALSIACDVASALDYAHRHGVVHRDIKPENILLHDGNALVADFGIALAVTQAGGERLTGTGVSIGTPQYMAPEQATGERTIGPRADIYALGAVTYEMLGGEPPFTGPTMQSIVGRALTESPRSLTVQRPTVSPAIDAAVLRALEKLPADRFATASEFAQALASPTVSTPWPHTAARSASGDFTGRRLAPVLGLAAAALVAGLLAGWLVARRGETTAAAPASRLALVGARLGSGGQYSLQRQIALTPDGATLLYMGRSDDGSARLMRQSLADVRPAVIEGVRQGIASPVVAPDGKWFLGIANGERIAYRYSISGGSGEPVSLGGTYTDFMDIDARGAIWFSPSIAGGLYRIDPGDTVARRIRGTDGMRLQQMLPDGRHAIVMRQATAQSGPSAVVDVESGEVAPLFSRAVQEIRYAAGFLVFVLPNGELQAAPFDVSRRSVTGQAVTIGTGVSVMGAGLAQFAVARNGTVAYIVEEPQSLTFVDLAGHVRPALAERHNYHGPRFSPDGHHIAMDFNTESGRDVWVLSRANGTMTRASFAADGHDVAWTPDGRSISYLSARADTERIFTRRWDGGDQLDTMYASPRLGFTGVWLRDGSGLVSIVNDLRPGSSGDIVLITNAGRGPAEPLAASEFTESYPAPSPDDRWLAYVSDRSGGLQVYVRPMRGSADVQVSVNGGTEPSWSPDGRNIYYRTVTDADPKLVAAKLRVGASIEVVSRTPLFSVADMTQTQPHAGYDISPDGRTFVMVQRTPAERIVVIQNIGALLLHQP